MSETRTGLKKEYVRVRCKEWRCNSMADGRSYGGNQSWFNDPGDGAIAPLGCGLISCADILLYKTGRTDISQEDYMAFVRSLNRGMLKVRRKLGVNGISMALGMRPRLKEHGLKYSVSWGFSGGKLLERITSMIENDIPVCIAVGPVICKKENRGEYGVHFYTRLRSESYELPRWRRSGKVRDHYVTVTGVYTSPNAAWLEISSWGEKYYISWDEYLAYRKLKRTFFSNILYIR
ncbi:MAG: hypothetical protein IKP47_05490 [Ruminococcus sp.]|nr:hypothetical protein [Ruminococcus sp.]